MAKVRVVLNYPAIAELGRSPAVEQALDSLGKQVAARAAQLAPKLTGGLAASIGHEVVRDGDALVCRVSWGRDQFHGLFLELGTSKMSAHPFLRPALEGHYTIT